MNPCINKLKALEKENKNQMIDIENRENFLAVQNMVRYLSSSSLSLYQVLIIQKDIIGMALEAEKEELTLYDKLGVEPREFCDDIILSGDNNARREHLMIALVNTIQFSALWFVFKFFIAFSMPDTQAIAWSDILTVILYYGGCARLAPYVHNRLALRANALLRHLPYVILLFLIIVTYTFLIHLYAPVNQTLIAGNGWIIVSFFAAAAAAATFLSNLYWKRCSRKYP